VYHDNLPVSSTVVAIPLTGVSGRLTVLAFNQLDCRRRSPLMLSLGALGTSPAILSGVIALCSFLGCFFGCLLCPKRQALLFNMLASLSRSLAMCAATESPGCSATLRSMSVGRSCRVVNCAIGPTNEKARGGDESESATTKASLSEIMSLDRRGYHYDLKPLQVTSDP
jgi:hypothetical protein